ncbi:MAG: cytochrome c3 family protein, partial [Desulfatirhabdiaceae bacterium]
SEITDVYHAKCIECHQDTLTAKEKSGPVTCGECHLEVSRFQSSRIPIQFDKSLHFRHSKAQENKCELCHHEFDKEIKKLFYAKEKEGSCRYCHQDVTQDNRISNREASHIGCIDCHKKTIAAKKKAGPVNCEGCHDPVQQAMIETVQDVPRMTRKQPDVVMMKISREAEQPETRMNFVPFDHKAHEGYNATCRVCHHESMNACNTCHTQNGTKEGKWVTLDRSMHQPNADASCMGCHNTAKAQTNCAGCHGGMRPSKTDELTCQKCHMAAMPKTSEPLSIDQEILMAKTLLDSRQKQDTIFVDPKIEDIPEKVTIRVLSHQYEPVEFPHRKIAQTLLKNSSEKKIAGYFHTNQSMCQGCHHNSPASIKPPKCQSCHGKPFDETKLNVPGLLGAYHQQCMGCHKAMNMEKPMGCTECHKEKS